MKEKDVKMTVEELEKQLFLAEERGDMAESDRLLEAYPELVELIGSLEEQKIADYLAGKLDPEETSREMLDKLESWMKEKETAGFHPCGG